MSRGQTEKGFMQLSSPVTTVRAQSKKTTWRTKKGASHPRHDIGHRKKAGRKLTYWSGEKRSRPMCRMSEGKRETPGGRGIKPV